MDRKPLSKDASLFSAELGKQIAGKALISVVLTLTAYFIGRFVSVGSTPANYAADITIAFLVLSWASVLNMFIVRTQESLFKSKFSYNPWLMVSIIVSILISAIVALVVLLGRCLTWLRSVQCIG